MIGKLIKTPFLWTSLFIWECFINFKLIFTWVMKTFCVNLCYIFASVIFVAYWLGFINFERVWAFQLIWFHLLIEAFKAHHTTIILMTSISPASRSTDEVYKETSEPRRCLFTLALKADGSNVVGTQKPVNCFTLWMCAK